jgi:hypothetical protein
MVKSKRKSKKNRNFEEFQIEVNSLSLQRKMTPMGFAITALYNKPIITGGKW